MTDGFRKKSKNWKDPETYDFKMVNEPLKKVYFAVVTQLNSEQQPPPTYYFIKIILETCFQTYEVIVDLVSDLKKKKYPIQAHMLSRSFVDAFFLLMALMDNSENTRKYELAGYRKVWEEYQRELEEYKNTPEAKVYLEEKAQLLEHMSDNFFHLTKEEKTDPRNNIKTWPIAGQFFRTNSVINLSDKRKSFLRKIYDWHYGQPSALEHFDWTGMAMNIFASHPEDHWSPGKYDSDAVYAAQLFLLMMLSEIDGIKKYKHKEELKYLWVFLGEYYYEVKQYYTLRYQELLSY